MHTKFNYLLATMLAGALMTMPAQAPAQAQPLRYATTWIGNSFGGGAKWVQNFAEAMYVEPDGTVYLASGWDEGGREFGIYKDGDVVGQAADTHGWGTGGGQAVAASQSYIYIGHSHGNEGGGLKGEQYPPKGFTWHGVSRRKKDGSHAPFPGGKGRFGDMLVLHEVDEKTDAQVRGLAVDGKHRLLVSDDLDDEVKVFDGETMQPLSSWKMARPRQIAEGTKGTFWIIQGGQGEAAPPGILHFSPDGKKLAQEIRFSGKTNPTALCMNRATGRLLVTDNGPSQNVRIYEEIDTNPRLIDTFGQPGGIFSTTGGFRAGETGPLRFSGPTGVGSDVQGNLYIACNQAAGGTILRSFSPRGDLRWELLGLEFVDTAAPDPASDGADVWTTENRYTLDWNKPVGRQWTWRSQTVDPFRFPNDPRLNEGHHDFCASSLRTLGGKKFLIVQGMFQHALVMYKIDGEIAAPAVMFSKGPYRNGAWKDVPQPKEGRWMWRDANGDGDFQAEEFLEADGVRDPESWAWWMDEQGGLWQGEQNGAEPIRYFPFGGLDARGNPLYSRATSKTFALPAPMNHLLRIEYLAASDIMYLTGHTTERPKTGGEWGQVGTEVLRFDNWSKGNRTPRWRTALPYEPETKEKTPGASVSNATIKSFCTAGDYFFAVESRSAKVHVYNANTGAKVGQMSPGPEVGSQSGWVDFPDAMRALRRKNGEYLVFVEEDWKGKVIVYRWRPAGA